MIYRKNNTEHIPLKELSVPAGHWDTSMTFRMMKVSHEWRIRPSVLGICYPGEDITFMIAYLSVSGKMIAFDDELAKRKAAAQKKEITKQ